MAHETSDLGEWTRLASRFVCGSPPARPRSSFIPRSQVHAWEIADQLLRLKRDVPTSTFAAHTMRGKIQFSFSELPVATHQALRESLMSNLTSLCEAPRTVTIQLSLALADLALQSNWLTAVMDTIQTFHDSLPKVLVMLDVLKYLPEEVSTGV